MSKSKLATSQDRSTFTFQRKLNQQDKFTTELLKIMGWRTILHRQHQAFIKHLLDSNRVTKEELAQWFPKVPKPTIKNKNV